jgi:hypothetical protein
MRQYGGQICAPIDSLLDERERLLGVPCSRFSNLGAELCCYKSVLLRFNARLSLCKSLGSVLQLAFRFNKELALGPFGQFCPLSACRNLCSALCTGPQSPEHGFHSAKSSASNTRFRAVGPAPRIDGLARSSLGLFNRGSEIALRHVVRTVADHQRRYDQRLW